MSLSRRLLLVASLVLAGFFGITGAVLDSAFRNSAETAVRDRLRAYVDTLLAAADIEPDGRLVVGYDFTAMRINRPVADAPLEPAESDVGEPLEARFGRPGSGLYARILDARNEVIWASPSLLGLDLPKSPMGMIAVTQFERLYPADGTPYFRFALGVLWERALGTRDRYTFEVIESMTSYQAQVDSFRNSLWGWFAGTALILLVLQGIILRWGLAPLHQVAADLEAIKSGAADQLHGRYPSELLGLTNSINAFIHSERAQRERYRNTLSDLAHSLKTPLAVLHGLLRGRDVPPQVRSALEEPLQRMDEIVQYQLRRPVSSGRPTLTQPVALRPAVERVVRSLRKVYADKQLVCELDVPTTVHFFGDEGDLMEILGNLLDNAFKWAQRRLRVHAHLARPEQGPVLIVEVVDDGPGIAPEQAAAILGRGVRLDEQVSGQGIGLAVVHAVVQAYRGRLTVERGDLGGACFRLVLPHTGAEA